MHKQTDDSNEAFSFNPSNFDQKIVIIERRLLVRSTQKAYNTAVINKKRGPPSHTPGYDKKAHNECLFPSVSRTPKIMDSLANMQGQ